MIFPCFGSWYIATNLELAENVDIIKHRKSIRKFVNEYLKQVGTTLHYTIVFEMDIVISAKVSYSV